MGVGGSIRVERARERKRGKARESEREERERESFSIQSGRLEKGAQSCIRIPTCTLAYVENLRLRGGGTGDKAEAVRHAFLFIEGGGGSKGQGRFQTSVSASAQPLGMHSTTCVNSAGCFPLGARASSVQTRLRVLVAMCRAQRLGLLLLILLLLLLYRWTRFFM